MKEGYDNKKNTTYIKGCEGETCYRIKCNAERLITDKEQLTYCRLLSLTQVGHLSPHLGYHAFEYKATFARLFFCVKHLFFLLFPSPNRHVVCHSQVVFFEPVNELDIVRLKECKKLFPLTHSNNIMLKPCRSVAACPTCFFYQLAYASTSISGQANFSSTYRQELYPW